MATIDLLDVKLIRKDQLILDIPNLSIQEGKIIGVVGAKGGGKTDFLKLIAGMEKASEGQVLENGQKIYDNERLKREIMYVSPETTYPFFSSIQKIVYNLERKYPNFDKAVFDGMMEKFQIPDKTKYFLLSRELQLTVNIMFAIAIRNPITILDQPAKEIPIRYRKELYAMIKEDHAVCPRTFIIASNVAMDIDEIVSEVIYLKDGEVLFHLPTNEIVNFAISLYGRQNVIERVLGDKEILYFNEFDNGMVQVIVRNDLNAIQHRQLLVEDVKLQYVGLVSLHGYIVRENLYELEEEK